MGAYEASDSRHEGRWRLRDGSDHSVPESVSLEQFRHFVEMAKRLGSYV